jgi:fructokinase
MNKKPNPVSCAIGLDIGGTKIAGAVFDRERREIAQLIRSTPSAYSDLVTTCVGIIDQLDAACGAVASIGVGIPGAADGSDKLPYVANIACLNGQPLRRDLEERIGRPMPLFNDAGCAALSEAEDGAGQGYDTVFGLILGTGVGGKLVTGGHLLNGAHGLMGEFGHLPLPFRESSDGPVVSCSCGQQGCIDKSVSGPSLARLYEAMTGKKSPPKVIEAARAGEADALRVIDQYITTLAKALVTVIHVLDPDIIVVSGGLCDMPGLYEELPRRWSRYAACKALRTKFVPAMHGPMTGLRGAAWAGQAETTFKA